MSAAEPSIAEKLAEIRARLEAAARAAGRDPASVTLVAVSKTFPADAINEALSAGQTLFGESRAQELRDKVPLVGPQARWHFIGALQRNKVKYVVGRVAMVESVDSLELARELDARVQSTGGGGGPVPLPVLVEVNLGGEETKHGVEPEQALALAREIHRLPGLALRGLMTIPPWQEDPEQVAPCFERLAALAAEGRAEGLPLHELSMGMSHDFEVAIRHGATLVRVGTAIFGARG